MSISTKSFSSLILDDIFVSCSRTNSKNILAKEKLFNPLSNDKILDWSKLKQSADNSFEFHVNSRKFSKLVENTVGKGDIACYQQFRLFPQCFQKACFPRASIGVIVWEWVKLYTIQYNEIYILIMISNDKVNTGIRIAFSRFI